ncbi:MAG TPA: YceI family protein [Bryobacteraceae bacterium]|jgi:polyisoprenoid-binding protein YceI
MGNATASYLIEPRLSRFTIQAYAGGLLSGFGHNPTIAIRDFTGEARFSPEALEQSSLCMKIRAGSLEVTNDVSDKDRREIERTMKEDVIETSRFPDIIYTGTVASISELGPSRYRVNLTGDLSLHGITRNQQVAAEMSLNGDTLRAFGSFPVLQSNFGITPVSVAGGVLKVKDELKCTFDIAARRNESEVGAGSSCA